MRSSRERKALITQPMRCRSHEIIAKILSEIRHQAVCNSFIFRAHEVLTRDTQTVGIQCVELTIGMARLFISCEAYSLDEWVAHT